MTVLTCPLARAAALHPQAVAIAEPNRQLTYSQLDRMATLLGNRLRERGVGPGDRFTIQSENSSELIILMWAAFRLGATICIINPRWPQSATKQASQSIAAKTHLELSEFRAGDEIAHQETFSATVDDDCLATIVFSSGSSGKPKAIALDLSAHLANATGANENLPLTVGDRWLLALPLCHVAGFGVVFRCVLAAATIVIPPRPFSLADFVRDHAITHVSVVPTQLRDWLEQQATVPSTLKTVLLGGSHWSVPMVEKAVQVGWPIFTTYGLSEMASQVCTTSGLKHGVGTSGQPLNGRELKLNPDGEILVRGDTLFRGYVTSSGFDQAVDREGWFHTRDRGFVDAEGHLSVLGRMDLMFISGGENIYPEEIEIELLKVPEIEQAVVVSVDDEAYGKRPVAFVHGRSITVDSFDPEVWRKCLATTLPSFKLPDRFLPLPEDQVKAMKYDRVELTLLANSSNDS